MKPINRIKILFIILFATQLAKAQHFTISNNLLYDATLTPNLRAGLRLSPHWSMGVTTGFNPWPTDDQTVRKMKHLLVSPDVRYWTDSVNVHHFFGFNLIYSHYNVGGITFPLGLWKSVRNERRQGDLGAIGAYYGYSWPLGRFWNLEAFIGGAFGYTGFDRYNCEHCGTKIGRKNQFFVMPQIGLSFVYNIPGRTIISTVPNVLMPSEIESPIVEKPFVAVLNPVEEHRFQLQEPNDSNFVMSFANYEPYDGTHLLRKGLFVHFGMSSSKLYPSYRENSRTLKHIVDLTRQMIADTTCNVRKIQIVGFASVDGNPVYNKRLSDNRAQALQHYIQQEVSLPDSIFDTTGAGEAWAELNDNVHSVLAKGYDNGLNLKKVIDIISNVNDSKLREKRIRQLDGGRTWEFIRNNILKEQRYSGLIRIYYDDVPDKAALIINEASELLTTDCSDCHHEALRLLYNVRNDERAQNAYGVALWLCGQREEALECLQRAADHGNTEAMQNLQNIMKNDSRL